MFSTRPRLGIALWLLLFFSVFVASAIAATVAVWAVVFNFNNLEAHQQDLPLTLVYSIAPWLLFLMAGVAITLINQKLEPALSGLKQILASPILPSKPWQRFNGFAVELIELDAIFAISLNSPKPRILISSAAKDSLNEEQLQAVLWHEFAHLKQHHNFIKRLARVVALLAGFVRASRVMRHEIDRLCELAADQYAAKRVSAEVLRAARAKFE